MKLFLSYILFFLTIFYSEEFFSQSLLKNFRKISRPEKWWAVTHPFIAKKAFRVTQKTLAVCDSMKHDSTLDGDINGGQLDAFKHCYWMALLASHIPARKAYKLGLAHEQGNKIAFRKNLPEDHTRPDSMACVMDIINDQVGIGMAVDSRQRPQPLRDDELISLVKEHLLRGELRILLKDKAGNFLTCEGEIINPAAYKNKWGIPKCLVKSDFR